METGKAQRRKDKNRIVLKTGETQRPNGTYSYRWTDVNKKRHVIYAKTLNELRELENELEKDKFSGIKSEARNITVNDVFEMWKELKRGLKDNTFQNYCYMYEMFVRKSFGNIKLTNLKKSDVKKFYNELCDGRNLKAATIDIIHSVLHQVLNIAVDDEYLRSNPSDNALKELKQSHCFKTEKRHALTIEQQKLFLDFLKRSCLYNHWYPIFAVMIGTGMRVGEICGLRWCDVDFKENLIHVDHTLVYYNHAKNGCYFNVHSTKTEAGTRVIPMLASVKEAFNLEREYQEDSEIKCSVAIDGYTDFIFVNRFGNTQHQGTLNKALKRIIRDCNDEILLKDSEAELLLPPFSCHSLRHTFTTRMIEAGVNMKVIQDALGHTDISTTLNIYADVTKDLRKNEFQNMDDFLKVAEI